MLRRKLKVNLYATNGPRARPGWGQCPPRFEIEYPEYHRAPPGASAGSSRGQARARQAAQVARAGGRARCWRARRAGAPRSAFFSFSLWAPLTPVALPGFPASHAATERPQSPKPTDLTALGSLPAITTARALRIAPQAPPQPPGPQRSSLKRRGHDRAPGNHWPAPPLAPPGHCEPVDFAHRRNALCP